MANWFRSIHIVYVISVISLIGLFSFRLNYTALQSYDEAWYGDIVRNLVRSRDPFNLTFNQSTFLDHPPGGFIMMSVPVVLLGSSEFSVRISSVVAGALTVMLLVGIGRQLDGKSVGISAAVILMSCFWFALRIRTGNLDALFLFWETLTVYSLLRPEKKLVYLAAVSFAMLLLTKTLVGFGLLPGIAYMLWRQRKQHTAHTWFKLLIVLLMLIMPWYIVQVTQHSNFLKHHFITIGSRGENNSYSFVSVKENLAYLAIGVGKWYKPWLVSLILGVLLTIFERKWRWQLSLLFWWGVGFFPFIFSTQTEIWHLMPLYPVIALSVALVGVATIKKWLPLQPILSSIFVSLVLSLAIFQWSQFSNLLYVESPVYSAEKDIALKARGHQKIYLLSTFYPAAVYYSESLVDPLYLHPEAYQALIELLGSSRYVAVIIDRETSNRLEADGIEFQIQAENESYLLVIP